MTNLSIDPLVPPTGCAINLYPEPPKTKALDQQIGGNHYKDFVIQPVEFIHKNGIGFLEGNVIKYVARHHQKNGKDDLLKAKHYIELLLELEYDQ